MGGKDSTNDAPNDDKGLKGFMPPKPVVCGFSGGDTSEALGVGAVDLLHNDSERIEPLEVVAVLGGVKPVGVAPEKNDDATPAILGSNVVAFKDPPKDGCCI
jgi:hypothetical protein